MDILLILLTAALGHLAGAYSFYFFHRYIFHGPLGRYPVLREWRAMHTRHHARPDDPGAFFFPWWANLIIWTIAAGMVWIVPAFGIGLFSFFGLYAHRHRLAHSGGKTRQSIHHMNHHTSSPRVNFSGPYPILDKVLGTYEPIPIREVNNKR